MVKIDLNADLGEGSSTDAALMTLVSSVNIACGFHAGDAQTMLASVRNAMKNGVAIGAHPSFPDRENFGRTAMDLPPETVYAQMLYQIGALEAIVRAENGVLRHVKPHGMLYNRGGERSGAGGCHCPRGTGLQSASDSGWPRRAASLSVPANGWG